MEYVFGWGSGVVNMGVAFCTRAVSKGTPRWESQGHKYAQSRICPWNKPHRNAISKTQNINMYK